MKVKVSWTAAATSTLTWAQMLGSTHKIYSSILIFIIIWRFWCRCHSRSRYVSCTSHIFFQMLQCCQYLTSSLGRLKQGFCHFVILIFARHKCLGISVPSAWLALNQIYCTMRPWTLRPFAPCELAYQIINVFRSTCVVAIQGIGKCSGSYPPYSRTELWCGCCPYSNWIKITSRSLRWLW